jgi:hypothetical protein
MSERAALRSYIVNNPTSKRVAKRKKDALNSELNNSARKLFVIKYVFSKFICHKIYIPKKIREHQCAAAAQPEQYLC